MSLSEDILYAISNRRVKKRVDRLIRNPQKRGLEYAQDQYNRYLHRGLDFDISNKVILEIGCGHGGISCFYGMNGAREVHGIDINQENLITANKFRNSIINRYQCTTFPVYFSLQNATKMEFSDNYFDLIIADNVFEHFDDNAAVLQECRRVLKQEGRIIAPSFPSIYSRNGAHLKKGIAVKWVYLFFKETTIVNVLRRNCKEFPILYDVYGGLNEVTSTIRGVRKYNDLNYLTNKKFKCQVEDAGLIIYDLRVTYVNRYFGKILKLLLNRYSVLHDIFSVTSSAIIKKP